MMRGLANPGHIRPDTGFQRNDSGSDPTSDDNSLTQGSDGDDDDDDSRGYVVDEPVDDFQQGDVERPTPPYKSIDEEKSALLWKIARAKKAGLPIHRNLTIHTNVKELRAEVARIEHEIGLDNGIKFMRRMLCLATSGIELLNNRYDPFGLALDGWSTSVQDDISSYDKVFERLYEKYQDKADIAPELQLLLLLCSSAFTFHLTKKMMASMTVPSEQAQARTSMNPIGSMLNMFMGGGGARQPQAGNPQMQQQQQQPALPVPSTMQRKPMRGPQNMLPAGLMPQISAPVGVPPTESVLGQKRPREESKDDETSDGRVSDIPTSDDGGDSDSLSPDSTSDDEIKIQSVPARGGGRGGRGRGGRGRGAVTRNVVTL